MRQVIHAYTDGRVDLHYEDVREFEYEDCVDANGEGITKEQWKEIHNLFSTPRYLWSIEPCQGVQKHLTQLLEKFGIHFATSRLHLGRKITVEWLEYYQFPKHDLHFVQHGEKHSTLGRFQAAVEDHHAQAISFAESGTPCYLIRHPWNKDKPPADTVEWVNDWEDLCGKLL